jgi:long-subunit fatty acid transport protein
MASASLIALSASAATAGGIDRSGQGIAPLFEAGNYGELSFGSVNPDVDGTDIIGFQTQEVAGSYFQYGFAFKQDINEKLSYAIILDQPFGADIYYPTFLEGGSPVLGGTNAQTTATALTTYLRYKFDERISVYGGLRGQHASGEIDLNGLAYGPFSGYNVTLDDDIALGYSVGASYEIPEIALRVSLTYHSKVTHEMDTVETFAGALAGFSGTSVTEVETPQSVNLDFQTGIAEGTLLFGQIRWADWSEFDVDPIAFTTLVNGGTFVKGGGLIDQEDSTTFMIGVGRRFSDAWSGAASVSYEEETDPLVSPLAPTNGKVGFTLAAIYSQDNFKVTTGINYTKVGDALPETGTPDVARASMADNSALGIGMKIGFNF